MRRQVHGTPLGVKALSMLVGCKPADVEQWAALGCGPKHTRIRGELVFAYRDVSAWIRALPITEGGIPLLPDRWGRLAAH